MSVDPAFIQRLIAEEVEFVEGDVRGPFDDADYEEDSDDGTVSGGQEQDTDDPNEGAV